MDKEEFIFFNMDHDKLLILLWVAPHPCTYGRLIGQGLTGDRQAKIVREKWENGNWERVER